MMPQAGNAFKGPDWRQSPDDPVTYHRDRMSQFFTHAPPAPDSPQRRLSEYLKVRHSVLASMPQNASAAGLYALSAMMAPGPAAIICPDEVGIGHSLSQLEAMGITFPEAAAFAPGDTALGEALKAGRVRLLLVTPERFGGLNFLDMLVRQPPAFVAIEEAEQLLASDSPDLKRIKDTLTQLREPPPVLLLLPILPEPQLWDFARRLSLPKVDLLRIPPPLGSLVLAVQPFRHTSRKWESLLQGLSESPGPALIHTAHPDEAEQLARRLAEAGLPALGTPMAIHTRQDAATIQRRLERFAAGTEPVLVNAGLPVRHWPADAPVRQWWWHPPPDLDVLGRESFRATDALPAQVTLLHHRGDFLSALEVSELQDHADGLQRVRRWLVSGACRRVSLGRVILGLAAGKIPPCGVCDRCLPKYPAWIEGALWSWLY